MKQFLKEPVVRGSILLLIVFNLYNVLNFGFQFAMGRLLDVSTYGTLATLFSFIYIFSLFSESIQNIVARFTVQEKSKGKVNDAVRRGFWRAIQISGGIYVLFICCAYFFLAPRLDIPFLFLAYTGLFIFSSFTLPITRGVLQGTGQFWALGKNLIAESALKLVCGVMFVLFFTEVSLQLFGALTSVFIGVGTAFGYAWLIQLKKIRRAKRISADMPAIKAYSFSVFIGTLVITLFLMMDIILVKALFSSEITGAYAYASLAAKTLFWGTQPISKALFPLTAHKPERKQLVKSIGMLLGLLAIGLIAFQFAPFIIKMLSGKDLPLAIGILFPLGIGVSFVCIANLFLLYTLAYRNILSHTWVYLVMLLIPFLFIPFLFFIQPTITEFTWLFVLSAGLLCAIAIVYTCIPVKTKK